MAKMGNEFPQCPRVHADWEFTLLDKITRVVKNTKKFRIVAIQNYGENYQHVAVVIPELSNEYVQIPELVGKFLSQLQKTVKAGTADDIRDKKVLDASDLKFTGNVYLYTDKLLVSEDVIRKHFKKNNMILQSRVDKQNLVL